ncbi:hypothetical protein Bca101_067881 [Brassica carinata]
MSLALAASRCAEGRVSLVPHFVVEMFAGFGDVLRMFAARNCCFGLGAGPRGRVSSTQGEASTFTVLREVLAFRDLFVYIKDDSYNSWSLVTSVSFHAVFTGRIELNRLTMSLNLPLTIWLLGLSFGMESLSYDF